MNSMSATASESDSLYISAVFQAPDKISASKNDLTHQPPYPPNARVFRLHAAHQQHRKPRQTRRKWLRTRIH